MDICDQTPQPRAEGLEAARAISGGPYDAHLAHLVFAARDLAWAQIVPFKLDDQRCSECFYWQHEAECLSHAAYCRTGRVLNLLKDLALTFLALADTPEAAPGQPEQAGLPRE